MPAYGGNLAVDRTPWWAMKPSPFMRGLRSLGEDTAFINMARSMGWSDIAHLSAGQLAAVNAALGRSSTAAAPVVAASAPVRTNIYAPAVDPTITQYFNQGNTSAYMESVMLGGPQNEAQAAVTAQQFRQGRPIGGGNYLPVAPPPGWDASGHYTPPVGTKADSTNAPRPPSQTSTNPNQNQPPNPQPGDVPMHTGSTSTADKMKADADASGDVGRLGGGSSMTPLLIGAAVIGGLYLMNKGKK